MNMIAKQFKTYGFQEYLGLSPEKIHCSSWSYVFPQRTIMSLKRSLNFLKEHLKPFFSQRTIMSLGRRNLVAPKSNHVLKEQGLKLPKGVTMFPKEQMCLKFCLIVTFAYEF